MAHKEPRETVTFFAFPELKERIRKEAQLRNRSMSQLLNMVVERFLDKAEEKRNQKNPNDEKES